MEGYRPNQEEIHKAEDSMSEVQKDLSEARVEGYSLAVRNLVDGAISQYGWANYDIRDGDIRQLAPGEEARDGEVVLPGNNPGHHDSRFCISGETKYLYQHALDKGYSVGLEMGSNKISGKIHFQK